MKTTLLGGVLTAVLFVAPASATTYDFEADSVNVFGYSGGLITVAGSVTFDALNSDGSATDPVTVSISLTDAAGTQTYSAAGVDGAFFQVGTEAGGQTAFFQIQTAPTPSQQLDLVFLFSKSTGDVFPNTETDVLSDVIAHKFTTAGLRIQGNVPGFFPQDDDGLFHGESLTLDQLQWTEEAPPVATTPLPPALPLFGAGLAFLAFLAMRRRGRGLEPVAA